MAVATYGAGIYGTDTYDTSPVVITPIYRPALPPLDLSVVITDAAGATTRWGSEDQTPETVPRGLSFTTQRMQGFATGGVTLSRRIDRDYVDTHLLDDVAFIGATGETAYEGRVGAMPRSFDTDHSQSLQLAGLMAHASDRTFTEVFVDRDLGAWGDWSLQRRAALAVAGVPMGKIAGQSTNGGLVWDAPNEAMPANEMTELWYAGDPNIPVSFVYYKGARTGTFTSFEAPTLWTGSSPDGTLESYGIALDDVAHSVSLTPTRPYVMLRLSTNAAVTPGAGTQQRVDKIGVYGDHGLPTYEAQDAINGVRASDVIKNLAGRYCPLLDTSGILQTTYPIPHLVFKDRTKPYDAFLAVNAYHLWNLAVWENHTLHYHPVDLTDYDWEIRTDDPGTTISLQGDSTEDLANGIVVQFDNVVTGRKDTLTPDAYPDLTDSATDNPANQHGLNIWTDYQLSVPTTTEAALQIGRAALAEYNAPKAPGSITKTHHIRDRAGHWQPVWKVRAGDRVAITSSASLSDRPRLISETSYDHDNRSVTIAVDSTMRSLPAVLDRIQTALAAANLS